MTDPMTNLMNHLLPLKTAGEDFLMGLFLVILNLAWMTAWLGIFAYLIHWGWTA